VRHGVDRFVLTSSTSVYGQALVPLPRGGAVWIDETVEPQPRDIYDVTKLAAEERVQQSSGRCLRSIILRMSRCFPESARTMALHRLHRGIDRRDVVAAHLLALDHVSETAQTYIVSGSSPFLRDDVDALLNDAGSVIRKRAPAVAKEFAQRGWQLPQTLDRVYSINRIVRELGFRPQFDSLHVLHGDCEPLPAA
jgi:nucleoside-diphosphate-sugar epimerase